MNHNLIKLYQHGDVAVDEGILFIVLYFISSHNLLCNQMFMYNDGICQMCRVNSTFALFVPLTSTKDANLSHHFIGRTRLLSSYTHFSPITTFVNLLPNFCIYYFVSERPPWTNFVNCKYIYSMGQWSTEKK